MPNPPIKVRYILSHENRVESDRAVIRKYVENVNSFKAFPVPEKSIIHLPANHHELKKPEIWASL